MKTVTSNRPLLLPALLLLGLAVSDVQAGVDLFTSQSAFNSKGNILQTGNYDDFGPGISGLPSPFSRAGVTYTTQVIMIGPNSTASNGNPPLIWNPVHNIPIHPQGPTLNGSIDTSPFRYDMFGFKLGYLNTFVSSTHPDSSATISVSTNLNSSGYGFTISMPGAENRLDFSGFVTNTPGEYITGFFINGSTAFFPGITDTVLGQVSLVPEPATLSMLGLGGLAGLIASRRRSAR